MSSRPSFAKRQKEQARKEKRRAKLERQQQRKRDKQLSAQGGDIPASDLAPGFITDEDPEVTSEQPAEPPSHEPSGS